MCFFLPSSFLFFLKKSIFILIVWIFCCLYLCSACVQGLWRLRRAPGPLELKVQKLLATVCAGNQIKSGSPKRANKCS